jgi:hypothetical protein
MASWDEFKYRVVQQTVGPTSTNKQKFKQKLTNHQIKVVYDRRERSHKLLKTIVIDSDRDKNVYYYQIYLQCFLLL